MIKKVFMCVSVLSLLLTACSKDEVMDSSKAIGFSTILAPSSRASVFTTDNLQDEDYGFRVSAYNQGTETDWNTFKGTLTAAPDFMNNTEVTYVGHELAELTAWTYAPVKYWPGIVSGTQYGRVTFFALGGLAQDNLDITYNATSHLPEFSGYTTPAAATAQEDLVAAVNFEEFWSSGKKVSFTFKHILSKIDFTAQLADNYSDAVVKVKSLQVNYTANKVKSNGIYAFNTTKGATGSAALGSWTPGSTTLSDDSGELMADADQTNGVTLSNLTAAPLNTAESLMLIPQTTSNAAGDLTVKFTYTITTGSGDKAQTVTYPVAYQIPANTTYEIGKQYTYNFTLTLNPVVFSTSTTVGDWDDNTDIPL